MIKLRCKECNYRFTPKKSVMPRICPFCGKEGTLEKVKPMQQIIDEVVDDMES
ncbi:MAG: hypothetical protein PHV16_01600 [Candidatus Nanoarchaeia archaeon]|nr:hypothetical protein [Candidatus Nanoarchaeia archaeon]